MRAAPTVVPASLLLLALCARPCAGAQEPYPSPVNAAVVRARYPLDAEAEAMLRRNGFVALDNITRGSLREAYARHGKDPHLFVTTDAMLRLWHEIYLKALADAEERFLAPELAATLSRLCASAERLRQSEQVPDAAAALRRASILLHVANRLATPEAPVPAAIRPEVDDQVRRVLAHKDAGVYPADDYTQYAVRGHYSGNPLLEGYFRASMWLSRRTLGTCGAGDLAPSLRVATALAAIVRADGPARVKLEAINSLRGTLAGKPNSVSVEQLIQALDRALGPRWTLAGSMQAGALRKVQSEISRPAYPATTVRIHVTLPGTRYPAKSVSVLSLLAVPDSELFQQTTHTSVPGRSHPSGCDVAAALGSAAARREIQDRDPSAAGVLAAVDRFRSLSADDGHSVYAGWMRALATLNSRNPRSPEFMRSQAWEYEKLNSCLAGWAQLRHANILYASQAYAVMGMDSNPPQALVEPNPAFFRAMASLAERAQTSLGKVAAGAAPAGAYLSDFAAKCREFEVYSEAELDGKLTPLQSSDIDRFGEWLERFKFKSSPIVADVATGSGLEVLHAGVGHFNPLIVIPDRSRPVAYVGWVASYYEFTRPHLDRLTDQRWQQMHSNPWSRPERPAWTGAFLARNDAGAARTRAPLREAERLFLNRQPVKAVALLRSAAADERNADIAAECRLRIARYLSGANRTDEALAELLACRRLPGGDGRDEALRLAINLVSRRQWQSRPEIRESQRSRAKVDAKIAAVAKAKDPAARVRVEMDAVRAALKTVRGDDIGGLLAAFRSVRTGYIREATVYLLASGNPYYLLELMYTGGWEDLTAEIVRLARNAESPAIRAMSLGLALSTSALPASPRGALRLLKPCLEEGYFAKDRSRALAFVHKLGLGTSSGRKPVEAVFQSYLQLLRGKLSRAAWGAGDLEPAVEILRTLPADPHDGSRDELSTEYADYADFDHEPLRMFVLAGNARDTETAGRFMEIYRRFPAARICRKALFQAENLYRYAGKVQEADEIARTIVQRYPDSPEALYCRARFAFEMDDLDQADRLLQDSLVLARKAPADEGETIEYGVGQSMKSTLETVARRRKALQPIAEPAGRVEILRAPNLEGDPEAVAARVAAALPGKEREIRAALLPIEPYPGFATSFLARFPDDPRAADAWKTLAGWFPGPEVEGAFADAVTWVGTLVNRGRQYAHHENARALLRRMVQGQSYGTDNFRLAMEHARLVREHFPASPAAFVADGEAAEALLAHSRPEAALELLTRSTPPQNADTVVLARRDALMRRAQVEIACKRDADWKPLWSARISAGPKAGFSDIQPPIAAGGRLLALVPGAKDETSITCFEARTGAVQWKVNQPGCQTMAVGPGNRLYCLEGSRLSVRSMDSGKLIDQYVLPLDGRRVIGAVSDGDSLVLAEDRGPTVCVDGKTGKVRWRKEWGWATSGSGPDAPLPPLIDHRLVLSTDGDIVRAIDIRTGEELWARSYAQRPGEGEAGRPTAYRLTGQPVAVGSDRVLVPGPVLEILSVRDGSVVCSVPRRKLDTFPSPIYTAGNCVLEVDGNGRSNAYALPDLSVLDRSFPAFEYGGVVSVGGVMYGEVRNNSALVAVDGSTGARIGWYLANMARKIAADGERIYMVSYDGEIWAFPILRAPAP